ncbi:MAG: TIGR04283 family arsenosugar biosynthesis glycosyltransferase [Phycisphaerae bacterium]|nr:TIGR04283 family arsenosugar biosynthesis glycosyltransferase [Phycisphaerae bacterium]
MRQATALSLISVVIPTLNEADHIAGAIASASGGRNVEIIVSDGGSDDGTVEAAQRAGARVVSSPRGRARQMNAGALAARGEMLLFLHADTRLPQWFDEHIRPILGRPGVVAGAFAFSIDSPRPALRVIERLANLRAKRAKMPYGDQAIFLRAEVFDKLGGFPDMPIMEDLELVRRLRRLGQIVIAPAAAVTSGRRWSHLGPLRTTLINQVVIAGYYLGVSPARLAGWYRTKSNNTPHRTLAGEHAGEQQSARVC